MFSIEVFKWQSLPVFVNFGRKTALCLMFHGFVIVSSTLPITVALISKVSVISVFSFYSSMKYYDAIKLFS